MDHAYQISPKKQILNEKYAHIIVKSGKRGPDRGRLIDTNHLLFDLYRGLYLYHLARVQPLGPGVTCRNDTFFVFFKNRILPLWHGFANFRHFFSFFEEMINTNLKFLKLNVFKKATT